MIDKNDDDDDNHDSTIITCLMFRGVEGDKMVIQLAPDGHF